MFMSSCVPFLLQRNHHEHVKNRSASCTRREYNLLVTFVAFHQRAEMVVFILSFFYLWYGRSDNYNNIKNFTHLVEDFAKIPRRKAPKL